MIALWAAPAASAQTISVSGSGSLTTVTTQNLELRTVLEAASFALNVNPEFEGLTLGEGCRFTGVPAFNPIGAPFRYGCAAGPNFQVTASGTNDIVLKRNQGAHEPFDVTATLGGGTDAYMLAGVGVHGSDTVDGGSGRDSLNYRLCTCAAGVDAGLDGRNGLTGFEVLVGSPGPDTLTGLAAGTVLAPDASPQIEGEAGDDTITTVNGIAEMVSCGPGNDHAIAEAADRVLPDCERVDLLAGAPVIGSGPSGVVGGSSARFEFALVGSDPPPGRFECALDGGSFTPCASPVELSGLADGAHVFAVRYHADGADPGEAAERRWTVDTRAPAVSFESAPAGEDNPAEALIAFRASEEAAFECSLDAGPLFDCSSPHPLAGLAAGPHSFSVQATDQAGNVSAPITATWVVGAPAAPQTAICAPGTGEAGFGVIRVVARAPDACFVSETVAGVPAQVSRGAVALNGISLTPAPGTRIIVSPRIGDGSVRADGPLIVGLGSLTSFTLDGLDLDGLVSAANGFTRTVQVAQGLAAGLPFLPAVELEFGSEDGGRTKVTLRVTLPRAAFRRLPGGSQAEGLTVEVAPTFSNDKGVTGAAKLKVAEAYLSGKVKLKDIELAFDFGAGVFDGSFGMELGRAVPRLAQPTITGSISLGPASPACGIRKLGLQASSLNRHVGYGIFVQRLGGAFECLAAATRLSANGGISFGPRIALGSFETEAISLDGNVVLTIPTGVAPVSLEITGTSKIVDIPVTQQTVKYTAPAQLEINGSIDLTIAGFGARLEQRNSWGTPDAFNIEALGQVNFFGLQASAEGVFSSTGYAVCLGRQGERFGFGKEWFEPLQSWSESCDVGPFRVAPPAAAAAQAGSRTLRIAPGRRVVVVAATGAGAPPKIVLSGPRGRTIRTPDDLSALNTREAMLAQDTATNTTYVALLSPPAGVWRVSGSFTSLRTADGLPPVRVDARVRRSVLTWSARGLAGGQRLQFVERARSGEANVLVTTRRARGRLRFAPAAALGARRRIEAIVLNRGTPRSVVTVARYRVAPPARPRRVRGIRLRSRALVWRRDRASVSYVVAVTRRDGTTSTHTVRRPRLRVGRDVVRVTVVGQNAAGRAGPAGRARVGRRR
jgi:hypothetical protein